MFLVFLENKVLSTEGPDQLGREFRDMQTLGNALRIPEGHRYAVFLTAMGQFYHNGRPFEMACSFVP